MTPGLSRWQRLLLWDYERGSWAYDALAVVVLLVLFLLPAAWVADPMVPR